VARLGRALIAQGVPLASAVTASVELREFGQRAVLVNGEQRARGSPRLRAARVPGRAAAAAGQRDELLDALFAGRSNFRRAPTCPGVHWLPPGAAGGGSSATTAPCG